MVTDKVFDVDGFLEELREQERIRCPHCGEVADLDTIDLADLGLITYWGEGEQGGDNVNDEVECPNCEREFRVRENVTRTYDTCKTGEEFD